MTEPEIQHDPAPLKPGLRVVLWTILILVVVLMTGLVWYLSYVFTPGPKSAADTVIVTIPKGTSVRGIGDILAGEGVIHNDIRFLLLAKFSGYGSRLQAGEFRLRTGIRPGEVSEGTGICQVHRISDHHPRRIFVRLKLLRFLASRAGAIRKISSNSFPINRLLKNWVFLILTVWKDISFRIPIFLPGI